MKGFMLEDVALATHADLPPLKTNYQASTLPASAQRALQLCLEQKLQETVGDAQHEGWMPNDEDLSALPIFQQALEDDAQHIQRAEEEYRTREEARKIAIEEACRLETERQRVAAEEAAAEAQRKLEGKEARRQARLAEKLEARARARAEEQRRYQELLVRWQATVEERQAKLDEVEHAISIASDRKAAVQSRLSELAETKATLLKKLRDLATRGTEETPQEEFKTRSAAGEGGRGSPGSPLRGPYGASFYGGSAGGGGSGLPPQQQHWADRDIRDSRHPKRPREYSPLPPYDSHDRRKDHLYGSGAAEPMERERGYEGSEGGAGFPPRKGPPSGREPYGSRLDYGTGGYRGNAGSLPDDGPAPAPGVPGRHWGGGGSPYRSGEGWERSEPYAGTVGGRNFGSFLPGGPSRHLDHEEGSRDRERGGGWEGRGDLPPRRHDHGASHHSKDRREQQKEAYAGGGWGGRHSGR